MIKRKRNRSEWQPYFSKCHIKPPRMTDNTQPIKKYKKTKYECEIQSLILEVIQYIRIRRVN